tara:strand:- start:18124 stop:19443 length:1320 start_codon:yes stop_codon:yes gene_type:complete
MTISENFIANYSVVKSKDLDSQTIEAGKNLFIDSLGNIIASLRTGGNKVLNQNLAKSLNGNNNMTPLYLGMLIHSLDFDDTHYGALIHTGAITVPAALHASFDKKIEGQDFIRALILGVDFAVQLASVEKHLFHKKGFHATSIVGVFSSAFVYGYLNKYSNSSLVNALGIAGSFCSGNLSFLENGDNTKIVHPGWASFSGCEASKLVHFGITGSSSIFEGQNGIYNLYSDISVDSNFFNLNKDIGEINNVSFKPYPICQLSISTIRLASEVVKNLKISDIEKMIVYLPKDSYEIVAKNKLVKSKPRTSYEAKFSLYWSLASFMINEELTVDSFSEKRLNDKKIRKLIDKIDVIKFDHKETAATIGGKIEILFKSGEKQIFEEQNPSNSILNSELILNKFLKNANLSHDDELIKELLKIDESDDVGKIIRKILNEQIKKY